MNGINRFKDILIHPRRLGLYFKDKFYIIIIYMLVFLGIGVGVVYATSYSFEYFNAHSSHTILYGLKTPKEGQEFKFENGKMIGSQYVISGDTYKVFYNQEPIKPTTVPANLTVLLGSETYSGYYMGNLVGEGKYSDILKDDYKFDIVDILAGDSQARMNFISFNTAILTSFNSGYSRVTFLSGLSTLVGYYFAIIIFMLIFSYFMNPGIEMKVRLRLVLYDSIVFLFVFTLGVIFNVSYLQYIAMALALIYTYITFSHIKRIVIKR